MVTTMHWPAVTNVNSKESEKGDAVIGTLDAARKKGGVATGYAVGSAVDTVTVSPAQVPDDSHPRTTYGRPGNTA